MTLAILYTYRRCPYAMRARMALCAAGIQVEMREISLREKPRHLLEVSPKGTVPVLVLPDGQVIDQSLDIMHWALRQRDSEGWLTAPAIEVATLIQENDTAFKRALDRYKYPERYPEASQHIYRQLGEAFLQTLEARLSEHPYLLGQHATLADVAIFPFIRQFSGVDNYWWMSAPYPKLRVWLEAWLNSALFANIMQKYPLHHEK